MTAIIGSLVSFDSFGKSMTLKPPTVIPLSIITRICGLNFLLLFIMFAICLVESLPSTVAVVVNKPSMKLPPR